MSPRGKLLVGGDWRQGGGEAFASTDPATGEPVWSGHGASAEDVADAFAAARMAFAEWSRASLETRIELVRRFRGLVSTKKPELAALIGRETGKPRWEAESEAAAMAAKVDVSLEAHAARAGQHVAATPFGRAVLRHKAHGVMAVFGPYNFPGHLPNGHIVPALIAGDVVVFKPSEIAPGVGEAMAALWMEAGAPPGVFNLVQGGPGVGAAMLKDPRVDGVLFTGSAQTGAYIHKLFGGRPEVMLALEMGGNNPLVVWDVHDADAAASLVVQSAYVTSGQRCSCARRLIVPEGSEGDRIVAATAALASAMIIGAWDAEPQPFMGPLVSDGAAAKVLKAQEARLAEGARAVLVARPMPGRRPAFLTPGLLELGAATAPDDEVFGPLLQVIRARSFSHALDIANDTRFGLAAGLVSDDKERWEIFVRDVRAGVVNWNRPTTGAASTLPFGGPGLSGNHRPGAWYAADYCAYPMASQEADVVHAIAAPGLPSPGKPA
jgi:succinylglutamic semialdehyde dehydrogenase